MKAIAALSDLLPALERSARATKQSAHSGGLGGFHLQVTDRLVVTGTDMEIFIQAQVPLLPGRKKGAIAVGPAKAIVQALKTLPKDALVTLEENKTKQLVVTSGRSTLKFDLYEEGDYPKVPISGGLVATIETEVLADGFGYVAGTYSTDASRPVLCGIGLEFERTAIHMTATDSYRLAAIKVKAKVPRKFESIIGGAAISEVVRIAKTGPVTIHDSAYHLHFIVEGTSIAARKIDGTFPDWRKLRPDAYQPGGKPEFKVTLDRAQALESCKRIIKLSDSNAPLRLSITAGAKQVMFVLAGRYSASVEDAVDAIIEGKGSIELGLHPKFFSDALATAQGEEVHLRLLNPLRPIFVSGNDAEDPDRWTIVMPIRLA